MRAESLQRCLGQLRQYHRAAEMNPSVARPRVSVISVMPALPIFVVVFERIIQAQIAAVFGNKCRHPCLRIRTDGFEYFTGIRWLEEHWSISGGVLCIDRIRLTFQDSGQRGVHGAWSKYNPVKIIPSPPGLAPRLGQLYPLSRPGRHN